RMSNENTAPAGEREHDVPAGRDELRERLVTTLAAPLGVQVNRAIEKAEAALLAPQEAREGEALRQTIAEAVERLADRLYPYWRSSEGDGSDYLAVANTIDVLAGKLAAVRPAPETREPD